MESFNILRFMPGNARNTFSNSSFVMDIIVQKPDESARIINSENGQFVNACSSNSNDV